jgi:hypothetical protein
MKPRVSLRKALSDPALLGSVLVGPSWDNWKPLMLASYGETLTPPERVIFKQFTGRDREPGRPVEEFVAVKGRRAGGSRVAGVMLPYDAGLCEHPALVPGERGVALCIAADQRQADVILDYTEATFRQSPVLKQLIESRTQRKLSLTNGIDIEVRAADFRNLRGITLIKVIADEVAFFATSEWSANPDSEILNAVRPGLATTGGPLFMISSPYARKGELWRTYQKHFGAKGDPLILVAQGSSRDFNPTLPQSVVDRAIERDPASAAAEYGGLFRTDIENFVIPEVVHNNVAHGTYERPPVPGTLYHAFCDPSGGSADAMTLAVGHIDYVKKIVVTDCLREVTPPFSPESVVADFSHCLKSYRVLKCVGDKYAGVWPVEAFGKFNITYEQSAAPKSDLYRDMLPLLNSGRLSLLDNPKLISQLCGLERRTARGGRDSIDHAPGAHDDLANAVAGLAAFNNKFGNYDVSFAGFQPDADEKADDTKDKDTNYATEQLRSAIAGGYGWGQPSGRRWT